eukprot:UN22683
MKRVIYMDHIFKMEKKEENIALPLESRSTSKCDLQMIFDAFIYYDRKVTKHNPKQLNLLHEVIHQKKILVFYYAYND